MLPCYQSYSHICTATFVMKQGVVALQLYHCVVDPRAVCFDGEHSGDIDLIACLVNSWKLRSVVGKFPSI